MNQLLIPVQSYKPTNGHFALPPSLTISSIHRDDALALAQLRDELALLNVTATISPHAATANIQIRRNRSMTLPEQYQLSIQPQGIEIVSGSAAGAFYGIQTLRELLRIHGRTLPCCVIQDKPLFARRGVYHDCSRGKVPTLATLKQLVDRLASWKINELQLYIENVFTFEKHPAIGRGYSPFTPGDLRDLQAYCKSRHMRLVPSLTSFGHFERILMLPEYLPLAELPGFRNLPGGTTLNPGNPKSIQLLADMYGEFLPLFESEEFNACGDEPWELGQGRSKRRADKIGVGQVYWDFMMKIRQLCLKHGKRMNIWGDIVLKHPEIIPQIPKDVVMLNWAYTPSSTGIPRCVEFADAGLPWIGCPGTSSWQSHGTRLQMALDNVSLFARISLKYGAEGLLNTDWGDSGHRNFLGVSLCGFAHGAAHAWNSPAVDDATHLRRFLLHAFGDAAGLLDVPLRCLGDERSGYWAYHVLMQRITNSENCARGMARLSRPKEVQLSEEQMAGHLEELRALRWPKASQVAKQLPAFEQLALEEFATAARMEKLAYERAMWSRAFAPMNTRRKPNASQLKRHAEEINSIAAEFSRLWKLRNRRSRLADNMAGFAGILKETQDLIK